MKKSFVVTRTSFKSLHELPNSWTEGDYKTLLDSIEYSDTSDLAAGDLREMCLMSLTDFEPEEAAKLVLQHVFGNRLTKGQVENLSNEMLDEKLWEEYADLSFHEDFFRAHQLLYYAFEDTFPYPEAIIFSVRVVAKEKNAFSIFDDYPEAPLLRLIVAGMPQNNLIYRLFDEQLEGSEFKEAEAIIWQIQMEESGDNERNFSIISSPYWFHDFKYVTTYEAESYADVK